MNKEILLQCFLIFLYIIIIFVNFLQERYPRPPSPILFILKYVVVAQI